MSRHSEDDRLDGLLEHYNVPPAREGLAADIMACLPQEAVSEPPRPVRRRPWRELFSGLDLRALAAGGAALALGVWIGLSGMVTGERPIGEEDFILALSDFETSYDSLGFLEEGP
jgi:hypothetical protein